MNCGSCGFDNPAGMRFCGQCGANVSPRCPSCSAEIPAGFKFCGECGSALTGTSTPATLGSVSPAGARTPADYTPKHLAIRMLG